MNNNIVWFPFYIGDYIKDTQELSPIEHGMYLKLMLWYYTKGKPIPHNKRYSISGANDVSNDNHLLINCNGGGASSHQLCDELLVEFFHRDGDVWRHKRIDGELQKQNDISEKRRAAVAQREANKGKKGKNKPASSDTSSDNHLMTQSQSQSQDIGEVSPITPQAGEKKNTKKTFELPSFIDHQTWQDFVEHRQRLRKPMTPRAKELMVKKLEGFWHQGEDVNRILEQSIEQGWQGVFSTKEKNNGANRGRSQTDIIAEQLNNIT